MADRTALPLPVPNEGMSGTLPARKIVQAQAVRFGEALLR